MNIHIEWLLLIPAMLIFGFWIMGAFKPRDDDEINVASKELKSLKVSGRGGVSVDSSEVLEVRGDLIETYYLRANKLTRQGYET